MNDKLYYIDYPWDWKNRPNTENDREAFNLILKIKVFSCIKIV